MIVTRWSNTDIPVPVYAKTYFDSEGLTPVEEVLQPGQVIPDHRHPFDEIRIVVRGSMIMNVAGTQLMLREGDRIEIPAHTKHAKKNDSGEPCICAIAQRPF
jgi:quercetin dioxygenase-like cupin family protein